MITRLQILVETLIDLDYDDGLIKELIVKYYTSSVNEDTFSIEEEKFRVLTDDEIEDELYPVAENLYYDYEDELTVLISRKPHLSSLIISIDNRQATNEIAKKLRYEEEFNCIKLAATDDFTIFANVE